jgi:hypothetical protein
MNWQIRVYNPTNPEEAVTAIWSADADSRYSMGNSETCDLQIPRQMSDFVKPTWTELVLSPDNAPRLEFVSDESYEPRSQSLFEGINFLLDAQLVLELKRLE